MMTLNTPPRVKMLKTVQVLIVEDEYILARNLKEGLESFGYNVVGIADSSETAIDQATRLRPNIILMDIRIRGNMDGIQTAECIWQQLRVPIVYVTGHSDDNTVERAALTFPFGYILKPIREKELYVAIQTALSRYERELFFSTVLEGMGDGVIVVDSQLHIKYLNETAERLTGWTLNEVKEELITETIPFLSEQTQLPMEHPISSALQSDTMVYLGGHVLLVRKDKTVLPIADSVALLKDSYGLVTGAVLVFRDDTKRRLTEERDRANERAQQAAMQLTEQQRLNQLKDDFLATTSHELRTPLSNIKLAICLLETVLSQQGILNSEQVTHSQAVNRYLSILREQCDQQLTLVNDLLDLRSLEADAYPLDPTTIQLQDWLPHVVEGFQERVADKQQTLQITIPPELPPVISDMPSLTRIISELLNNACKYTPSGEMITVEAMVEQGDHSGSPASKNQGLASTIVICVRNSGVEIPTEQLPRIFEPFYRVPDSDPWKHGGTGLGLAIVKKLVAHLQGTINVVSDHNWTSFMIQLPLMTDLSLAVG